MKPTFYAIAQRENNKPVTCFFRSNAKTATGLEKAARKALELNSLFSLGETLFGTEYPFEVYKTEYTPNDNALKKEHLQITFDYRLNFWY